MTHNRTFNMRTLFITLLILLSQSSFAADCLKVSDPIELQGTIERQPVSPLGSIATFLKLPHPVCWQNLENNGHLTKHENINSFQLVIPEDQLRLLAALQIHAQVTLRGELLYPTFDEKSERIDKALFLLKGVK